MPGALTMQRHEGGLSDCLFTQAIDVVVQVELFLEGFTQDDKIPILYEQFLGYIHVVLAIHLHLFHLVGRKREVKIDWRLGN